MTDLKPCPFCGGMVTETSGIVYGKKRVIKGTFDCLQCHATISIRATYTTHDPFDALYEAWNRRDKDAVD